MCAEKKMKREKEKRKKVIDNESKTAKHKNTLQSMIFITT